MDDSRGAMILARTTKKQDSESVVEKAMNLELLTKRTQAFVYIKKTLAQRCPISKSAKVKVVERSECYRPLVLEMKEWPDAFIMFSQGPYVLETRPFNRERKITFCELCEVHFNDFQKHLRSIEHTKKLQTTNDGNMLDLHMVVICC